MDSLQIIYSILEQEPTKEWFPMAVKEKTGFITRVPHASGMLDGTYNKDTVFDPSDHRSHRKQEWLETTLKKVAQLDFLMENMDSTISQIAIKFALSGPMVSTVGIEAAQGSLHESFGLVTYVLGTLAMIGVARVLR